MSPTTKPWSFSTISWQLSVIARRSSPPESPPLPGGRYIVDAADGDGWQDHAGSIAVFLGTDGAGGEAGDIWQFLAPGTGWRAWVEAENSLVVWNGAHWQTIGTGMQNGGEDLQTAGEDTRLGPGGGSTLFLPNAVQRTLRGAEIQFKITDEEIETFRVAGSEHNPISGARYRVRCVGAHSPEN